MVSYKTLDEALAGRQELVERIQLIDAQLSERSADIAARRVPDEQYREYKQWKSRACFAKVQMNRKLAATKLEIQRLRNKEAEERVVSRGGTEGLLEELYKLIKTMVADGVDIDPSEQRLIDDVQAHLNL